MNQNRNELKLLLQELKNPYKQLNFVFLLISVIPVLACIYALCGKLFLHEKFLLELAPILFFSNLIMILGYWVGYKVIKNVIRKILAYATRAKRSEELRASMALALAHDLKSPLSVIKANMSNLKAGHLGPLTRKQEEMAGLCTSVAERTAVLLMDLIKTYALGEETSELIISSFDLRRLVEEQLREIAALSQSKNIKLKVQLSKIALPLDADRSLITRVINNLLNNAIKYTPPGGRVTVKAFAAESFVRLEFLNTGPSIPEHMLEKIFDRYERLDRSVQGEGLGLAIARAIAEAHRGKVWAESAAGKPNCFTVLLPLAKSRNTS